MIIRSATEMADLGQRFARQLTTPAVFELIGDVGAGKTTFTQGLARGLGIKDPITSPSFTISKRYAFVSGNEPKELVHYDFYRLNDPGLMSDELAETLQSPNSVVVIEWGSDVANLLPAEKYRLEIILREDGGREVHLNHHAESLLEASR